MPDPKEQVEGCWPDGSSGAITADFCAGCRTIDRIGEKVCSGADFSTVAVLPAAVSSDLAEALERLEKAIARNLRGERGANVGAARDQAHKALETYRNATGGSG